MFKNLLRKLRKEKKENSVKTEEGRIRDVELDIHLVGVKKEDGKKLLEFLANQASFYNEIENWVKKHLWKDADIMLIMDQDDPNLIIVFARLHGYPSEVRFLCNMDSKILNILIEKLAAIRNHLGYDIGIIGYSHYEREVIKDEKS